MALQYAEVGFTRVCLVDVRLIRIIGTCPHLLLWSVSRLLELWHVDWTGALLPIHLLLKFRNAGTSNRQIGKLGD